MHIVLPTPGGAGLYLAPNIIGWVFISVLISIGLFEAIRKKTIKVNRLHIILLVGIVFLLIPFAFSGSDATNAVPRFLGLVGMFALLISIHQFELTKELKIRLLTFLQLGVFIEILIGLFQYFILMQFDLHIVGYSPVGNRPYGSFTQPNVMSSFLVTGVFISLYILSFRNELPVNKYLIILSYFICLAATFLVVLLQSKTGYVGYILSFTILILFSPKLIFNQRKALLLICIGILLSIISTNFMSIHKRGDKLITDGGVRSDIIFVSLDLFKENPFKGTGYGSFEREYKIHHLDMIAQGNSWLKKPLNTLGHPHNEMLLWVIEGGVIALVGLAIIFFGLLYYLFKAERRKLGYYLTFFIPIMFHTQTEYPFYHSIVHFVYLIVFLVIIFSFIDDTEYEIKTSLLSGTILMLFLVGTLSFMLTGLQTMNILEKYKAGQQLNHKLLDKVLNPIIFDDYIEVTVYTASLRNGFKNRNTVALIDYIKWGLKFNLSKPREGIYKNILLSASTLKNIERLPEEIDVKKIQAEAKMLYPETDWSIAPKN